jgi:hypothetical protein
VPLRDIPEAGSRLRVTDPARCAYWDREDAREAATSLKAKQPHAEVTLRDIQTGTGIKHSSSR